MAMEGRLDDGPEFDLAGDPDRRLRILLIDDDEDERFLTRDCLNDIPGKPYRLDWTPHFAEGLEALCGGDYDIYLLDYRLGEKTGIDLLREAHARGCVGPVILLTGQGQSRTAFEALYAGADDYLEKDGLTPEQLDRAIRYTLVKHRTEAELEKKVQERTEELGRLNAALRDADRRKDEFLGMLAHELRNPLAPITNTLEIMRLTGDADDRSRRNRERLERQVSQLNRLVEDLLDVTRITTGKLNLVTEILTLQSVVETALESVSSQFDSGQLTLTTEIPAEPIPVEADRVRLAQVLANLLQNAAKFTEPGGHVWFTVTEGHDQVTIAVRDNGIGIEADKLPEIFTLFTQGDRPPQRAQGGLGIGLSLVKELVAMHGGTVEARSDGAGSGSTFLVHLPKPHAKRADEPATPAR